jgi:hypothetical protein
MITTFRSCKPLAAFAAGAILWTLCFANAGAAQSTRNGRAIDAGTVITVRTNETINADDADGRVFTGVVDQDVKNRQGYVAIPRGSDVEMVVRKVSDKELSLDLDSVMINGQRYGIQSESNVTGSQQKEGIGVNKRTGKYVGGGAILGAIIGGIAGGGKGAAIGAGAGAAAGAGAQVLTRGGSIKVPAESLLTFRLAQPLQPANAVYSSSNIRREKPGRYSSETGDIRIGADNNITWDGPPNATVYVQVDNEPAKLFAAGQSGTQAAPWITEGHVYVFIMKDASGNEVARDRLDLRPSPRRR